MSRLRRHLPNALTTLRLLLAILFFWIPFAYQLTVVLIAAATDLLDGALARRWKVESEYGRVLDPIADRAFVGVMAVTFFVDARVTLIQLLLVGLRDVVVALGAAAILAAGRRSDFSRISTRAPGKAATVAQFVFLVSVLVLGGAMWSLVVITALISAAAAFDYAHHYWRNTRLEAELPHEV